MTGSISYGCSWGALSAAPRNVSVDALRERLAAARLDLAYYTPDVHKAVFSLPGYIKKFCHNCLNVGICRCSANDCGQSGLGCYIYWKNASIWLQ